MPRIFFWLVFQTFKHPSVSNDTTKPRQLPPPLPPLPLLLVPKDVAESEVVTTCGAAVAETETDIAMLESGVLGVNCHTLISVAFSQEVTRIPVNGSYDISRTGALCRRGQRRTTSPLRIFQRKISWPTPPTIKS